MVQNSISTPQKVWLQENVGEDLGWLFQGGITWGGHGLGLSSCGDFGAASFGIETIQEAIEGDYLGANIVDQQYYTWFHWPAYTSADPDEPVYDCTD